MKAITFQAVEELAFETVDDPQILHPRDAIVRVRSAGLCGSDLHPYHGRETGLDVGTVMGHEFVGEVVALGDSLTSAGAGERAAARTGGWSVALGDRVVAPFTTACGECFYCRSGLSARCTAGALFGWVQDGAGLHGAQAELVRVPFADTTLVKVPDQIEDDGLALLAGDILSTAIFGAEMARVSPGDSVVVVGCGPVGLLAIRAALEAGAAQVFAIDRVPTRLEQAARFGAVPLNFEASDPVAAVREATEGRGADGAIEAVGSAPATRMAADVMRHGGAIGAVGVHTEAHLALPPGEIYDRNLTYSSGRCPARRILPAALQIAARDSALLGTMISHRLPLSDGVAAYRSFAAREPGWNKVVFRP